MQSAADSSIRAHSPTGPWRWLWSVARPHRRALLIALALGLVAAACGLAVPLGASEVIEALSADRSIARAVQIVLVLVVLEAVLSGVHLWLLDRTGERIVAGARRGLVARMLRLEMPVFDRVPPGDLVARVTSDTTLLRAVATSGITEGFTAIVTIVAALVLMGIVDIVLLLVSVGVLAVIAAGILFVLPGIGRATQRAQAKVGAVGETLERAVTAIRTVRASGAEDREIDRVTDGIDGAYREGMRAAKLQAVSGVTSGVGLELTFLAVLGVGGARVAAGHTTIADLIAFLLYLFFLAGPITSLTLAGTQLQVARGAAARIREFEDYPLEDDRENQPQPVPGEAGPILRFDDVTFGYSDGQDVLADVTFELPRTGHVAIVGPSGSGKTTIFSLIEGFCEPRHGRIVFDGVDVTRMPRSGMRSRIGYVEQDAPVLAGTLRENLAYAAPEATDEDLMAAARTARLDRLIANLPGGLGGVVGPRGMTLSGGERQRVAIARALARKPDLLLLDEVTAQLDAANERALSDTIATVSRQCAVVVIAHRLSTVVDADAILVLEGGRIRATGRHEALIEQDTLYRELAQTQLLTAVSPSPIDA